MASSNLLPDWNSTYVQDVLGGGLEWPVCLHVYMNIVKGKKLRFSIREGGRFDKIKVPPHIRLTAVPPQSLTYQTDGSTTTKPDASD